MKKLLISLLAVSYIGSLTLSAVIEKKARTCTEWVSFQLLAELYFQVQDADTIRLIRSRRAQVCEDSAAFNATYKNFSVIHLLEGL